MAAKPAAEKISYPPIIRDLPDEWGTPMNYFNGCIAWAKVNLVIDGPKVLGAYYDGFRMRTFSAYRLTTTGCHIRIELPDNHYIEYTQSEARLYDQYDRPLKQFLCLRDKAGDETFMLEWELVKQRNNKIFEHMGATNEAVWNQCRRMAYPFGKQFGRTWLADMGGSKTHAAVRALPGGRHGPPVKMLKELLLFLLEQRNTYRETALFEGGERAPDDILVMIGHPNMKRLKDATLSEYGEFIRKCREILDVIDEKAIA